MSTGSSVTISDNTLDTIRRYSSVVPDTEEPNGGIGLSIFAMLYTTDKLTLCQAYHGLYKRCREIGFYELTQSRVGVITFLGHRFHPSDVTQIELAYNGNVDRWLDEHTPTGWYGLFSENKAWYNPEEERSLVQSSR